MIYFSVCTRKNKQPKSLSKLISYCNSNNNIRINISYDSSSIYEGHKQNINFFNNLNIKDNDIIVLCHDDLEILSKSEDLIHYLEMARKPKVGFLGLAGGCYVPQDGGWWNARKHGAARGFVFQGDSQENMYPNYFGKPGQVVVMDGILLAATYKTIKTVGLDEPAYLKTGWDFYDIHLTYKAHLDGFFNYVVPIIAMHESSGQMREGWYQARLNFLKNHASTLPYSKLVVDKTNGLP